MTGDALERLAAAASRDDYGSMVRLARALYTAGADPRAVLRRCYGVDFPEEVYVLADSATLRRGLSVSLTSQPWHLAIPPERKGPWPTANLLASTENQIYTRDPDLLPAALLWDTETHFGHDMICYRLTALGAGRPTVFRIGSLVDPRDEAVVYAGSLLDALHKHATERLEQLRWRLNQPWNRGAGSVDNHEVEAARSAVRIVEDLRARTGPSGQGRCHSD